MCLPPSRSRAEISCTQKGNVFHFLHFNAIFNLFVLVEAVADCRGGMWHAACGMWLLQLVTLVCWATHIPSLIGISWLQALELVKSSEFLEVGKGAGTGGEEVGG